MWLADSTTLALVGAFCALSIARTPGAGALALVAAIPLAIAVLLYTFLGAFVPAHLLVVAAALTMAAEVTRK